MSAVTYGILAGIVGGLLGCAILFVAPGRVSDREGLRESSRTPITLAGLMTLYVVAPGIVGMLLYGYRWLDIIAIVLTFVALNLLATTWLGHYPRKGSNHTA